MFQTSDNNKRIAKNTLLLYFRMLFMMMVSLYTSRVILNTLGVVDYGINNVVGGVIAMLGFLTGSLGAASSRYITFDLGKGDMEKMKRTFGNILSIHYILAVFVFIFGETLGLWFMMNKLNIPHNREFAALWVYQFSIFSSILGVLSVPYNAAIIAHEKMSAFAYISILDVVLKLLIVYALLVIPYDKLIVYVVLFFCIQLFDRIIYGVYCYRHFEETRVKPSYNKKLFKEIFAYAGWTINGNLAVIGFTQGINILLNMFFGPAINAARGIAVQVQTVCQNFCTNFQMAINPQLTKSYAQGEISYMHQLLVKSSKFSFFILFLITLPLMFEAKIVLHLWLGLVPNHTINFLRLILVIGILYTLSNPILTAIHATGDIKKFQIVEGTLLLLIVPIAYVLLKYFHVQPETVFCVHIVVELITQFVRLKLVLPKIQMQMMYYVKKVLKPILHVVIVASIIPFAVRNYFNDGFWSLVGFCAICFSISILTILYLGCSYAERTNILDLIESKLSNKNKIK